MRGEKGVLGSVCEGKRRLRGSGVGFRGEKGHLRGTGALFVRGKGGLRGSGVGLRGEKGLWGWFVRGEKGLRGDLGNFVR